MDVREKLREAVARTSFKGEVYIVGGEVRDRLLGRPSKTDLDLVLVGDSKQLAIELYEMGVAEHYPTIFERFGTVAIQIDGFPIEIVQARKESYRDDSRKPTVVPGTLEEDALRRDFTCNTMLDNLETGEIVDPLGVGLADLKAKILRTPLDPEATFHDDPLRMLRAVRFKWNLEFEFAPGLADSIRLQADRLQIISKERIREELTKMLLNEKPSRAIRDLADLNLLKQFAPELIALIGVTQGSYHHLDAWDHTLLVLDNAAAADQSGDHLLRLAALFHDIAKPQTRTVQEDGRVRFFGHDDVGEEVVAQWMNEMKYSGDEISTVKKLVKLHMRFTDPTLPSSPSVRRIMREVGDDMDRLLSLVDADRNGMKAFPPPFTMDELRDKVQKVATQTPLNKLESPLTGAEIMGICNLEQGTEIGRAKDYLLNEVLEGRLDPGDKEAAKRSLVQYMRNPQP